MKKTKRGFTLIELLVVVIIIAILAAIAVPQYKHAVLKSRFSTVMPMAKTIADAQEVYYLGNGQYALSTAELDVSPAVEGTSVALAPETQEDEYNYVATSSEQVPGARYIMYQKNSPKFAGTIHCEADENNADALWLCEKGLGGTEIPGSINTDSGSYKTFLLAGTQGTDKLPTSIYKLKAQICGTQFEGANCIVDEENNTITTQECSGGFSIGGNYFTRNCIKRTYDDSASQTDYVRENTECSYGSGGFYPQTSCSTYKYNEDNTQLPGYTVDACRRTYGGIFTSDGCVCASENCLNSEYYVISEMDSNGQQVSHTTYKCTALTEDNKCASVVTQTYPY